MLESIVSFGATVGAAVGVVVVTVPLALVCVGLAGLLLISPLLL